MASYTNGNMTMLTNGRAFYPIIAVGSYCTLSLEGCAAGTKRTIACGGKSVTLTIGSDGKAQMSLMPFIRNDIQSRNVQNVPFITSWRGLLSVTVSVADDAETTDKTLSIYYIFGYLQPVKAMDEDVYVTFNSATDDYNILAVDLESHYTSGVPNSLSAFRDISSDPADWSHPPTENSVYQMSVLQVASSGMQTGTKNYHFALDCRTENIVQLRWIDGDGYPNTRKFAYGSDVFAATRSDAYQRPHLDHTFNNLTYDYGRDEWATIDPQRTITIGDDAIPQNQWSWLKGLIVSQCVEMLEGGVWRRVNITTSSMERNPRKDTFNMSVTLSVYANESQKF